MRINVRHSYLWMGMLEFAFIAWLLILVALFAAKTLLWPPVFRLGIPIHIEHVELSRPLIPTGVTHYPGCGSLRTVGSDSALLIGEDYSPQVPGLLIGTIDWNGTRAVVTLRFPPDYFAFGLTWALGWSILGLGAYTPGSPSLLGFAGVGWGLLLAGVSTYFIFLLPPRRRGLLRLIETLRILGDEPHA